MSRRHFTLGCIVTTTLLSLAIATPAAATATTLADVDYAALGDSYSSGVGAPGQTGTCLRSPYGYAFATSRHTSVRSQSRSRRSTA